MKKHILILLAIVALAGPLGFGTSPALAEELSSEGTLTVYYFHGTFRCPTCHKLETYAQESLENNFKDALASGKITFKIVNVEDKENGHYVNDYQLYTKALVLSLSKEGKEIRSKHLAKIWEYVGNKDQYENYVRDEITAFLKEP